MINVPIPNISEKKNNLIEKTDEMLCSIKKCKRFRRNSKELTARNSSLQSFPEALPQNNLSKKLQNWEELSFADFLKELSKTRGRDPLDCQKSRMEDSCKEQQKAISIKI